MTIKKGRESRYIIDRNDMNMIFKVLEFKNWVKLEDVIVKKSLNLPIILTETLAPKILVKTPKSMNKKPLCWNVARGEIATFSHLPMSSDPVRAKEFGQSLRFSPF